MHSLLPCACTLCYLVHTLSATLLYEVRLPSATLLLPCAYTLCYLVHTVAATLSMHLMHALYATLCMQALLPCAYTLC